MSEMTRERINELRTVAAKLRKIGREQDRLVATLLSECLDEIDRLRMIAALGGKP